MEPPAGLRSPCVPPRWAAAPRAARTLAEQPGAGRHPRRVPARALPGRRRRPRQKHADGPILRRRRRAAQAPGPLPRLHAGRPQAHLGLAPHPAPPGGPRPRRPDPAFGRRPGGGGRAALLRRIPNQRHHRRHHPGPAVPRVVRPRSGDGRHQQHAAGRPVRRAARPRRLPACHWCAEGAPGRAGAGRRAGLAAPAAARQAHLDRTLRQPGRRRVGPGLHRPDRRCPRASGAPDRHRPQCPGADGGPRRRALRLRCAMQHAARRRGLPGAGVPLPRPGAGRRASPVAGQLRRGPALHRAGGRAV